MWCILLSGCDKAFIERLRDQRDRTLLAGAVDDYWLGLRWSDPSRASLYLDDAATRLAVARHLAEPAWRLTEVAVLQVELGALDTAPDARWVRTGTALLKVEAVDLVHNRVETSTLEQHWHRGSTGWTVDSERSPPSTDRAW